ncbi:energy transducer TonB [Sessilibacter sp. MAH1]
MIAAQTQVQPVERLTFTLFVAAAIHALIIFGLTFDIEINPKTSNTLDITLVTSKSDKAPEKADFIAQSNQEGSGTEDVAKPITTEQLSEFNDTQIRSVEQARTKNSEIAINQKTVIVSQSEAKDRATTKSEDQETALEQTAGEDSEIRQASEEIASLKAELDRQREAYARKPRIRRLTSVAAIASADAEYLQQWSQKVEFVGNRNFPKEALNAGIHGKLRLLAVIDHTGNLISAEVLQSSGYKVLDDAAIQIVHLSAPFPKFPSAIREDVDQLEIIRTWYFEIDGLSTGS